MDEASLSWGCAIFVLIAIIGVGYWIWSGGNPEVLSGEIPTLQDDQSKDAVLAEARAIRDRLEATERELVRTRTREQIYLVVIVFLMMVTTGLIAYALGRRRALNDLKKANQELG